MTRPLPRRLAIVVATLAAAALTACSSPTAPAPNTDEAAVGGGTYGGSSTKMCGGTYGGSSTC